MIKKKYHQTIFSTTVFDIRTKHSAFANLSEKSDNSQLDIARRLEIAQLHKFCCLQMLYDVRIIAV
jgi:hypothetical protein